MKRIAGVMVVAAFLAATVIPAFASDEAQPAKERNLFKIIKNSISWGPVKEKNRIKNPAPVMTGFQTLSNAIKEGSEKSRGQSLRTSSVK